jgi:UDPglucose 6-dehydrogenase
MHRSEEGVMHGMADKVTIFGAGYVGLVSGACLAHSGHDVTLLETDEGKLDSLRRGVSPIFEPGAEDLIAEGVAAGRLRFLHPDEAGPLGGILVIAVGTPTTTTGAADLTAVRTVVDRIASAAEPGAIVAMKSTVPAGTGVRLAEKLRGYGCEYVSNPEFLREGSAVQDWYHTDRIVLGGTPVALERMKALYADIDAPVLTCDITSAEMIKYASNAFLATKISFINEIASICDFLGAQVDDVAAGIGMDARIGKDFLRAGIGWGGSCFPKDTRALDFIATINGYDFHLLRAVIEVNARQRVLPVRALKSELGELEGKRVAVLGLTFKPETDDTREAPALEIIPLLAAEGAEVVGYNPRTLGGDDYAGIRVCRTLDEAVACAEAVIITTEWPEIRDADWTALITTMAGRRLVYDGRNCLDPGRVLDAGGTYIGVGRPQ